MKRLSLSLIFIFWLPQAFADEMSHDGMNSMPGMVMSDHSLMPNSPADPKSPRRKPTINGEGMESMPMITPKRIYTVRGSEDFDAIAGYGNDEGMVSMMNLMMVEGSGMEEMDMSHMHMQASNDEDPLAPENSAKYSKGNKNHGPHSDHAMGSPARLKFQLEIQPNPPLVGKNKIVFSVSKPGSGTKVKGMKIKSRVEMTSMDMGTEDPEVKELSDGRYEVSVNFAMKGPWKVRFESAEEKNDAPFSEEFRFDAGSKTPWVQSDK